MGFLLIAFLKLTKTFWAVRAGLAEMTKIGLPVPPGFIITTAACKVYQQKKQLPPAIWQEVLKELKKLEKKTGKKFNDPKNPLLVSVRSGAPVSMPGMMDTVLNLGLNKKTAAALSKKTKNPRFAADAYRRFIQMFANIVKGVPLKKFEDVLEQERERHGFKSDTEFSAQDLEKIIQRYRQIYQEETGETFPEDPLIQLQEAIKAVFNSWGNKRPSITAILIKSLTIWAPPLMFRRWFWQYGRKIGHRSGLYPQSATGKKNFTVNS